VFTRGAFGGIGTDTGASNIQVTGCRFEYIGNWNDSTQVGETGVGFDVTASNWQIEGNIFHDIGRTGGLAVLNHDHGIYAAGTNVLIINNIFYNLNKGWSIQMADGAANWLVANNTFAFASAGPGQVMLWKASTNIAFQNNIFYQPARSALEQYAATVNGCAINHNLVFGPNAMISGVGALDFITTTLNGCSGTNQFGMNPGFVNITQPPYDFHLQPGSPAIAAGIPLSAVAADFDGVTRPQIPSMGAYEPSPPSASVQRPLPSSTVNPSKRVSAKPNALGIGGARP